MDTETGIERARREGVLFGIPVGDMGWFVSLLIGIATGVSAFFLATFMAIVVMLSYRLATGSHPDFAETYLRVGFPVGVAVTVLALGFLGVQWVRRMARKLRKA